MPRPGTTTQRGYTWQWRKLTAQAIHLHPYCTYCGTTNDLTGDHRTPLSQGGKATTIDDITVACRSCNSKRGASRFFRPGPPRPRRRFSRERLR